MYSTITEHDLSTGYINLRKCIDIYLERYSILFKVSENAPSTYLAIRESRDSKGYFSVYNGGDSGLLGLDYNIKFRAVHDHGHYVHGLSFKFEDERQLSRVQSSEMALIAYRFLGLTQWESYIIKMIVNAEIAGQIDYYETNGKYVENQTEFIYNYFGIDKGNNVVL